MIAEPELVKSLVWERWFDKQGRLHSKHRRNPANFYKCVARRRKKNRIASESRLRNRS